MNFFKILILLITVTMLYSCQKEEEKYLTQTVSERTVVDSFYVSPGEARAWFEKRKAATGTLLTSEDPLDIFSLDLDWSEARNATYSGDYKVSMVPVKTDLSLYFPGGYYNMFFFRDSLQEMHARLLVFEPERDYALNHMGRMSVKSFTGYTLQVDETGAVGEIRIVQNGVFTHHVDFDTDQPGTSSGIELRGNPSRCPWQICFKKIREDFTDFVIRLQFDISGTLGNWFDFLGGVFGNGEGGNGHNTDIHTVGDGNWGPLLGPFGDVGNHNGGSSNLRDYFRDEIFNNNQLAYQMSECFAIYDNETTPLIFATHRHTQDWDNHFILALNYYLKQNSEGNSISFATALQTNFDNTLSNIYSPVGLNNHTQQAMLKVYHKMVLKYHGCKDDIYASTEGPIVFDLGSSELCDCIKNYTADDALRDFIENYLTFLPSHITENPIIKNYLKENPGVISEALEFIDTHFYNEDALLKHLELLANLSPYEGLNIDLVAFISEYGADTYLATATMYESFMLEIGVSPKDPYQWQLMMETFLEELLPVLGEFLPGVGDLIGAYNDFKEGNYFWGCFGIISTFVPGDEVIKIWRKAPDIRKAWNRVNDLVRVIDNLTNLAGAQRIFSKIPNAWKNLPGSKLADNGKGLKWNLSNDHHFRLMEANTQGFPSQNVPYGKFFKNGSFRDKFGNPLSNGNLPEAHIPIEEISDNFLDWFFN